jgi:hypothetical protein
MGRNQLTAEFLHTYYVQQQKSTVEISKMTETYPEQVRRALKKYNIPVRSRSKASRNFYENGGENARKGYKFTEQEKEVASLIAKEFWLSGDSSEARKKISKSSKKMWENVSDEEKKEIVARLHQACRLASINGSKTQIHIAELLQNKYGYEVLTGVTQLVGIGNLEVDIALPAKSIVIEVDGITHFDDVYSDNRFERAQEHDARKNNILNQAGWSVIRVQLMCERYSKGSCLMVCQKLDEMIKTGDFEKNNVTYIEAE